MPQNKSVQKQPVSLTLHGRSRVLEVHWPDGSIHRLPIELMRVYSPSAEVKGHGPGQEVLQTGKREVGISSLTPIGNYAILPKFTDGHETGIYTWDYLMFLGSQEDKLWKDYEARLAAAGVDRDTPMPGSGGARSITKTKKKTR